MAKKPITFDVDKSLLSEEEIAELQAEVRLEAEAEAKAEAKKQLRKRLVREEKIKAGLEEEQVEVTVDLAPYADKILLDNVAYLHGVTYTVPSSRAMVMREVMQNTWGHQSIVDGKSENFYRKSRGSRVVPVGNGAGVVNSSQLLKA